MITRSPHNPLITPQDVPPSRPDFTVLGAFNAGVALYNDETILLMRVSEAPINSEPGWLSCPYITDEGELTIKRTRVDDPDWDVSDPRKVRHLPTGAMYLTSISHLRLARSRDGINFEVSGQPFLAPQTTYERFGVEDCRITCIAGTYYINYSAVSPYGISTALASTTNFESVQRHGLIFAPANRNVVLFPERVNGQYVAYHRPMPGMFGSMHIWIARSPDLIHWGEYEVVLEAQVQGWQSGRVGSGAPPIKTERGWLSIYHAADRDDNYCLGAFLTPSNEPSRVIARSDGPVLLPQADYEKQGFFDNVIFTCGAVLQDDTINLYYGAADERIALATTPVDALLQQLLQS